MKPSEKTHPQSGFTPRPLLAAVLEGDEVSMLTWLERSAKPNDIVGDNNDSLLHIAVQKGYFSIAQRLIHFGARLDAQNLFHDTPLHAAARANQAACVRLLLENNREDAFVNATGNGSRVALHYAARFTDGAVATQLIECSARVDAGDKDARSPLHEAVVHENLLVARKLLEGRACATLRDRAGLSPLDIAIQKRHLAMVALLLEYYTAAQQHEIRWQIAFETLHIDGTHWMRMAIEQRIYSEVLLNALYQQRLLNFGDTFEGGMSLLHLAAMYGQTQTAAWLMRHGMAVDSRNESEYSPLHIAAGKGDLEMVKLLVSCKATIHLKDKYGETALDKAAKHGHRQVAGYLASQIPVSHPSSDSHLPSEQQAEPADARARFAGVIQRLMENQQRTRTQTQARIAAVDQELEREIVEVVQPDRSASQICERISTLIGRKERTLQANIVDIEAQNREREASNQTLILELQGRLAELERRPTLNSEELQSIRGVLALQHSRERILAQQREINAHPDLRDYYVLMQARLNAIYIGSKSVVSGMAKNQHKEGTGIGMAASATKAAGGILELFPFPGVHLIAAVIGSGIDMASERESQKRLQRIANLAVGAGTMEMLAEEVARSLTLLYQTELQRISQSRPAGKIGALKGKLTHAKDVLCVAEANTPVKKAAETDVKRILKHVMQGVLTNESRDIFAICLVGIVRAHHLKDEAKHKGAEQRPFLGAIDALRSSHAGGQGQRGVPQPPSYARFLLERQRAEGRRMTPPANTNLGQHKQATPGQITPGSPSVPPSRGGPRGEGPPAGYAAFGFAPR